MQLDYYAFTLNDERTHYFFESVGKKGVIPKAINFSFYMDNIYNLALLDYDPVRQEYVDDLISDNGDMPEVMATVIRVIINYLGIFPARQIFIEGNTPGRTRLYQIAISKVLPEVDELLQIAGYENGSWGKFEQSKRYERFLIAKNQ